MAAAIIAISIVGAVLPVFTYFFRRSVIGPRRGEGIDKLPELMVTSLFERGAAS